MPASVTSGFKIVSFLWRSTTVDWTNRLRSAERQAFRWVQKYIGAFGGDPTQVTMYVRSHRGQQKLTVLSRTSIAGVNLQEPFLSPSTWSPMGATLRGSFAVRSWSPDPPSQSETLRMGRNITTLLFCKLAARAPLIHWPA